jgi:hypothetical protein
MYTYIVHNSVTQLDASCRVQSAQLHGKSEDLRRRSLQLETVGEVISGGCPLVIPADHGLAMKTTVFSHQLKRGKATEPHGTSPLYRPLCILYYT